MQIMRCTQSFQAAAGGANDGGLFPDSHPLVEAYPQYFEPATEYVERMFPHLVGGVEQATAEPGEKRVRTTARATRTKKTEE